MDNQLNISVKLNGKKYNLVIPKDEKLEMLYRKAADMFNEAVHNYKLKKYEGITETDILAMVGFNYTLKFLQAENFEEKTKEEILESLQEINHSLDAYLE